MSLPVVSAGRRWLPTMDGLAWSNTDPGGFEQATIPAQYRDAKDVRPDDRVRITIGGDVVFMGRVNEPAGAANQDTDAASVVAVGAGVIFKEQLHHEIYVDSDLSHWTQPGAQRSVNLETLGYGVRSFETKRDDSGNPCMDLVQPGTIGKSIIEAFYDAHGITINKVAAKLVLVNLGAGDVNTQVQYFTANDDLATGAVGTGDIKGSTGSTVTWFTSDTTDVFGLVQHIYNAVGPGGTVGLNYGVRLSGLVVAGNHNVFFHSGNGVYPADVAADAIRAGVTNVIGKQVETFVGTDPNLFAAYQVVYFDYTPVEQIIDDMAKLLGWHYGTWEPHGLTSEFPQFLLQPPPTDATAAVDRLKCSNVQLPKIRRDLLYNGARVTWTDGAGVTHSQLTTINNPLATVCGITARYTTLDAGPAGTSAAATLYATGVLTQLAVNARGSGSLELPDTVTAANGMQMPSFLLKAGRDRLRVINLPDAGIFTEVDSRRLDTFRIARVSCAANAAGRVVTTVELDVGADLLEVLNARLAEERLRFGVGG